MNKQFNRVYDSNYNSIEDLKNEHQKLYDEIMADTPTNKLNYSDGKIEKINSELIQKISRLFDIESAIKKDQKNKINAMIKDRRIEISACRDKILSLHDNCCDICGISLPCILEVHHIIPLSKNGENNLDNLTVLCPNCHSMAHKYTSKKHSYKEEITVWTLENYSKPTFDKFIMLIRKYYDLVYSNGKDNKNNDSRS